MKRLTCFSSRSRGTCCAVILERLAENCRGRTTAIICTRTNAPKYILESHRLHFGSICDQNGCNFEPCVYHILLKALFRSPFMVRGNTFKCGCVGPADRDCEMSANEENGLLIAMTSLPGVLNQFKQ